ncbi:MAG: tetratricopeptide repeat protein [Phototrophicaceae bacterium]
MRPENDNRPSVWTWLAITGLLLALSGITYFTFYNYQKIDAALNVLDFEPDDIEGEDTGQLSDEEIVLERAKLALAEAEQAVDLAFNLLGIFEALSLAITVGGVILTAFGLTRFTTARTELEETRKLVEQEFEAARSRFETAISRSEEEVAQMRLDLENSAQNDRQRTSDALLANALIPLGERQYRTADYRGALSTYNRALDLDPENPVINQRLGYVYTQTGELDEAKRCYEKAIARENNFAPALAGLGFVQRRLGEQAGKGIKDDMSSEQQNALIFERDQLLNDSEKLLLEALKLSPKLVDDDGESYWGILGGLYKRRGQNAQAIEAYKRVTEVTPQSSYGYVNLALLYQKVSDRQHALDTYVKVEQIASKEAEAEAGNFWGYSDLISSSFAIGKHEQALEKLPIAISIAPLDSPFMLEGLRDTLLDLLDFLEEEKLPPIQVAVEILNTEMNRRKTGA